MKTPADNLPDDILALKKMLQEEREKNQKLEAQNLYLLEQFRQAQQKQFGKSSEVHADQGDLFNEAEQILDEAIDTEKQIKG